MFFPDKGIMNAEYCSCGKQVPACPVWKKIITRWNQERSLDLNDYCRVRKELTSKKNVFRASRRLKKPVGTDTEYLQDTEKLYNIIFDVTGCDTIVDSSKAPGMIPVLKKLDVNIRVIHIKRRFGDVLNSYKAHLEKNLKAGVEHELKPRKTLYVIQSWLMKNLLTVRLSKGTDFRQIKYEDMIADLEGVICSLVNCSDEYRQILKNRGPLYPRHLVAGSTIRMKDELYVAEKPMGTSNDRLSTIDKIIAKCFQF